MTLPKAIESLSREELLVLVGELLEQNRKLQEEVSRLRRVVEELQAEKERLKREGKKQAVPFSRGKCVKRRKRSGRKKGKESSDIASYPYRNRSPKRLWMCPLRRKYARHVVGSLNSSG